MPLPTYTLVAGDTGTVLTLTCQDAGNNNAAINLTGMTVKLLFRIGYGVTQTRSMTIVDAVNGKAKYQFVTGDLVAGIMEARATITDGAGNVISQLQPYVWEVAPSPLT
jgi:hypothetical protein